MRIASAVRATRALTGGIVAAHAAVAAKRASFNPLVQGSTPWRPTSLLLFYEFRRWFRGIIRCLRRDRLDHPYPPQRTRRSWPDMEI